VSHLKRLAAPRQWSITKKTSKWAPATVPGPHAKDASVPLLVVLRDYLRVCDTNREARSILDAREVLVDGKVVTDPKHGVGLMDVVSIPKVDATFRVLLDTRGKLALTEMQKANAGWKLCRIQDKSIVTGGVTQLHLHDGRNLVVKEAPYKTGDVLRIKLPEQKVMEHFPLANDAHAFITGGTHVGENARIAGVEVSRGPRATVVQLKDGDVSFSTVKDYVFVVGKDKPEIRLPEERYTAANPWRKS